MDKHDYRKQLLLKLYDQLWNSINVHITAIWQSVSLFIGAFALLALIEKNILSLDMATSLIIIMSGWLLAHVIDASFWYNRNLVMIANIEREFFEPEDAHRIHFYFVAHRPKNRMIKHYRLQFALGVAIGGLFLLHHFVTQILPNIRFSLHAVDIGAWMPYACSLVVVLYVKWWRRETDRAYANFLRNSPGGQVSFEGIVFDAHHGFRQES
jgi:hypothetical protein